MKTYTAVFLMMCLGCRSSEDAVKPEVFQGTWSFSPVKTGELNRWTFEDAFLSMAFDSSGTCVPATAQQYKYRVEKNELVMHYIGITNGFTVPDSRFTIISASGENIVLRDVKQDRRELIRCR